MTNSSRRRAAETRIVEMVFPDQTNHYGTLFGGHALRLMDQAAFISASRYCRSTVVTACSERVDFHTPVQQGELVELVARVIAVGKTSVKVEVQLFAEQLLSGRRKLCTRGRFVLVALDSRGRPKGVPRIEKSRVKRQEG
jgi:uncharacterized protein (TIGR00369 family)